MPVSQSRAACASTHFRIQYPNSRPRVAKLVGLGEGGGQIARRIAARGLRDLEIIVGGEFARDHAVSVVKGVAEDAHGLHRRLGEADLIFMIARSGDQVDFARVVSRVAREHGKLVTGVLIEKARTTLDPARTSPTLDVLRACADMLVIGSDESYLDEMLNELGAP
jgi:cell division GTPase FtsZ